MAEGTGGERRQRQSRTHSFREQLRRPSFEAWRTIFVECAKILHAEGKVAHGIGERLPGESVTGAMASIARIVDMPDAPKRGSTGGLINAVINYRNLTRGHGCVVHDGYEAFLYDFEAALFQLILWWKDLLDAPLVFHDGRATIVIDGEAVDAELFVRAKAETAQGDQPLVFYNRSDRQGGLQRNYFLNYDTGLHQNFPEQGAIVEKEIRLQAGNIQLGLFPANKDDFERTVNRDALALVKRYLSFKYDQAAVLQDAEEAEVRTLLGMHDLGGIELVRALVKTLNQEAPGADTRTVYFDFPRGRWAGFAALEEHAVEAFREDADVLELAELLVARVGDALDDLDEDVRTSLVTCLAELHRILAAAQAEPEG